MMLISVIFCFCVEEVRAIYAEFVAEAGAAATAAAANLFDTFVTYTSRPVCVHVKKGTLFLRKLKKSIINWTNLC